jgi:hypothetical protein
MSSASVPDSTNDKRSEWECPGRGGALDVTYISQRLWYNGTSVGGCLAAEFYVKDQVLAQEMCPHQLSRVEFEKHFQQLDGMASLGGETSTIWPNISA